MLYYTHFIFLNFLLNLLLNFLIFFLNFIKFTNNYIFYSIEMSSLEYKEIMRELVNLDTFDTVR